MKLPALFIVLGLMALTVLLIGAPRRRAFQASLRSQTIRSEIANARASLAEVRALRRVKELAKNASPDDALRNAWAEFSSDIRRLSVRTEGNDDLNNLHRRLALEVDELGDPRFMNDDDRSTTVVWDALTDGVRHSLTEIDTEASRQLTLERTEWTELSILTDVLCFLLAVSLLIVLIGQACIQAREATHVGRVRAQTVAILESIADLFYTVDSEWRFTFVNELMATTLGASREELIGRTLWEALPWTNAPSFRDSLIEAMNGNAMRVRDIVSPITGRCYEVRAYPFEGGLSVLSTDTTERQRERELLRESQERSLEASHAKSLFLASMSHEIRTPLNAVIGAMSLLEHESLPALAQELVLGVRASGESLLRIISDILDFSRMEAGEVSVRPVITDLRDLCASVLEPVRRAAPPDLKLVEVAPVGSIPPVMVDSVRLRQVIGNLLGNAVKYCASGTITLEWRLEKTDGLQNLMCIVRDTGIGIRRDRLQAIFEPFTQADASTHVRFGGTGLGLTICKTIVAMMGGEIGVSSIEGSGSEFWFRVPATIAEGPSPTPAEPPTPTLHHGTRVLVVDDNGVNVKVATRLLQRCGCEVAAVYNGCSAVERSLTEEFDIVLMDVSLPDIDGLEATRQIREHEGVFGGHRVVVALTANAMSDHEIACLEAGMDGFLPKPVTLDMLRNCLGRFAPPPQVAQTASV